MSTPRTCVCGPHDDLYDPAQHTEDGHGGCVICHFYEPHTDEEFERVRWPCAVVREAEAVERSAGGEPIDVERLTATLWGMKWNPDASAMARKIAAEYARLASKGTDR